MIKVIKKKPVPKGMVTCYNCGSELEYSNTDLQEDYWKDFGYCYATVLEKHTIRCPVCGCDTPATWIQRKDEEK